MQLRKVYSVPWRNDGDVIAGVADRQRSFANLSHGFRLLENVLVTLGDGEVNTSNTFALKTRYNERLDNVIFGSEIGDGSSLPLCRH